MDHLLGAVLTGCAATALMDGWSFLRKRLFQIPLPDYGLLGRWIGHISMALRPLPQTRHLSA